MAGTIVVVGSLNMDLVMRVDRFPKAGETRRAHTFETFIGGKGLNQAIAAARQGCRVRLIGRVGSDSFAETLRAVARREGIEDRWLLNTPNMPSGVANIVVERSAENFILLAEGANGALKPADVEAARAAFAGAQLALMQLEVPLESVLTAARLARQAGAKVVLVPAPARPLPAELLKLVDILVANRDEISAVLSEAAHEPELDARRALRAGVGMVIVTLGARGAFCVRADQPTHAVPAFTVHAVDTTGAGDAFVGGLVAALAAAEPLEAALRRAAACGALACTVMGAEPSLPRREAVEVLLHRA
jgi:ribokinase